MLDGLTLLQQLDPAGVGARDHIIDLGPEGGDGGGMIIATGTPEELVKVKDSYTGHYLKTVIKK